MIRVPPEVHEALAHPASTLGDELQAWSGLALVPVVVLERVVEEYATNLPVDPLRALRLALVLLVGLGAAAGEYGRRRGARHACALGQLVDLAAEVDAARRDLDRRAPSYEPAAYGSARARVDALAREVEDALAEAAVALRHGGAPRPGPGPRDLHRVLVANEEGVVAPSAIRIPPSVERAVGAARPWSGRAQAIRFVGRLVAGLLHRTTRLVALAAVAVLAIVSHGLGPSASDLAVVALLGTQLVAGVDLSTWLTRVAAGADPRLERVEGCAAAVAYGARLLEPEDLDEERILRRRVMDAALALDELGPLGSVGRARWERWTGRHAWLSTGGG